MERKGVDEGGGSGAVQYRCDDDDTEGENAQCREVGKVETAIGTTAGTVRTAAPR